MNDSLGNNTEKHHFTFSDVVLLELANLYANRPSVLTMFPWCSLRHLEVSCVYLYACYPIAAKWLQTVSLTFYVQKGEQFFQHKNIWVFLLLYAFILVLFLSKLIEGIFEEENHVTQMYNM